MPPLKTLALLSFSAFGRLALCAGLALQALWPAFAQADFLPTLRSFDGHDIVRIGTGRARGVYSVVGQRLALGISDHTWLPASAEQPLKMLGVAQHSGGAVANLEDLKESAVELALVQADVAFWAYRGVGRYLGHEPYSGLRAIASLYPEDMHIVIKQAIEGDHIRQLSGRRVSIGEPGSGSLVDAKLMLEQANLSSRITPLYLPLTEAVSRLGGEVDAVIAIAGYPTHPIESALSERGRLIGLPPSVINGLTERYPYFFAHEMPASAYDTKAPIPTVAVSALLVVDAQTDERLVHAITTAIWQQQTLNYIRDAHPQGYNIRLERALRGLSVPLHPGASRFYREQGLIEDQGAQP